jgi:hypothetical protein
MFFLVESAVAQKHVDYLSVAEGATAVLMRLLNSIKLGTDLASECYNWVYGRRST